jgi:hypothetical protein
LRGRHRLPAVELIFDRLEGRARRQIEVADVTSPLRDKSDEELQFHLDNSRWPTEDELLMLGSKDDGCLSSSAETRQRRVRHGGRRRSKRSARIRNQGRHGTECPSAVQDSSHAGNSSTPCNSSNVADSSNAALGGFAFGYQRTTTLLPGAPRLPNNPYADAAWRRQTFGPVRPR